MAKNISPFAALTSEEKQMKWMEYQSIRLPYTQISREPYSITKTDQSDTVNEHVITSKPLDKAEDLEDANNRKANLFLARPIPPAEVFVMQPDSKQNVTHTTIQRSPSSYQQINDFQKSNHRQYAAVIERMKQAEKKTGNYQAWDGNS